MGEKIYQSIIAVMEDVGAIGKDKKNQQQNFMYRGVDDVMNALNPAFIKHKIFMVPQIIDHHREDRTSAQGKTLIYSVCTMKYTVYAEDGSFIETITAGEAMDSGDKSMNKAMATAFKYACFQLFCIPTEEMTNAENSGKPVDPDSECHELATKPANTKPSASRISKKQVDELLSECDRIGKSEKAICVLYKIQKFADMDQNQYKSAIKNFKATPDKPAVPANPATIPPENADEGLPWKQ
ncbi:ERF family protein [Lacrimispora sp.]|uniref:ERF family protein n=1 Tax=Lacrimispora sp. TaxID=2719234 RepID=UPI00345FB862